MPYASHHWIHGFYVDHKTTTGLIANIKNHDTNESKLFIKYNPERPVWVAKKSNRINVRKRLCIPESETDMFITPQPYLGATIKRALGIYKNLPLKILLDSPYVYGGSASVESIYKRRFMAMCPGAPKKYNKGFLDIETSVLGGEEVVCISYVDPNGDIYLFINQQFFSTDKVTEIQKAYDTALGLFKDQLKPEIKSLLNKLHSQVHIELNTERNIILKALSTIHATKPDFIGIWNMSFDIPYLLKRLEAVRTDPRAFCHPEVPRDLQHVRFKSDSKRVEHPVDRWDWFYCTGYTQYVDLMCLYGRLRVSAGREMSYTLQYVASKILGVGKIEFPNQSTHQTMQQHHIVDYVVYNIFDSILIYLLEAYHQDIDAMCDRVDVSSLFDFAHQTVQLTKSFYDYCRHNHLVPCSIGRSLKTKWDDMLINIGGTVLDPLLLKTSGYPILQETDMPTNLYCYCVDFDAKSMYPNIDVSFAIDSTNKRITCLQVDGIEPADTENIFTNAAAPFENAVLLEHEFCGLPSYSELFDEWQTRPQ